MSKKAMHVPRFQMLFLPLLLPHALFIEIHFSFLCCHIKGKFSTSKAALLNTANYFGGKKNQNFYPTSYYITS